MVCQRSDVTVRVEPGTPIVDALETVDIWVPSACREGICGTCETRSSTACGPRDSLLSDEERADGKVMLLLCVRALSPKLVLDV